MRKVLMALSVLLVVTVQAARANVNPNAAPADEYFGPYRQSVLEIRNRLNDYDRLDPNSMLDPSVGGYLDHLQLAIRDWQHKYPSDPWLPRILGHLMREYWRAGEASSPTGLAALAFMRAVYPDSEITTQTVTLVYGSNPALDQIASDTAPPPAYPAPVAYQAQPAPVAYQAQPESAPLPAEAAMPAYADIPSYATPTYAGIPSYATPLDEAPVAQAPSTDAPPPDVAADDSSAPPPMR
ncbi:MAG TPA: hypothetical protein VFE16_13130 [Candidatus Cybelea sp.]|jgi:hypothetical protein|nr:hypothetical protein [Candidatus Cybelea sp.]